MTRRDDRDDANDAPRLTGPRPRTPTQSVALDSPALRRRVAAQPLDFPPIQWPATDVGPATVPAHEPSGAEFSFPPPPPPAPVAAKRPRRGLAYGPPAELTPHAKRWLRSLPRRCRPKMLAEEFPHVVNRLAIAWGDRALVERCFDQLMIDHRGDRHGFPKAASAEVLALHGHYQSLFDRRIRLVSLDAPSDPGGEPTEPIALDWRGG